MYEVFEQLMKDRGLTHYGVWKHTGVSQSSLSDWRRGRGTPGALSLAKIADFFGVTVDYLMGREIPTQNMSGNLIKLRGRDGSFVERKLSDEQLQAIKFIISQMPDETGV
jgi:transcriptional regulator with XRE-family HTH domain